MSTNVPMTNQKLMLAMHEQKYGHSVSFVELADGRVLLGGGNEFRVSADGGLTWSEPFKGKDDKGNEVHAWALVRLSGEAIGLVFPEFGPAPRSECDLFFRRSQDDGRTWSAPVQINPQGYSAYICQDVLCRTSSGRILLPAYLQFGQVEEPAWHLRGAPYALAWVNGNLVSTDAHFYDPSFSASLVFYSDDDGKTWQRSSELLITLDRVRVMESAAEPSVAEVAPGRLMMIMRTRLGRYFQAWSHDNGESWTWPEPTHLAGTQVPAQLRLIPSTGHLLCVFTQHSEDEVRRGFMRARLSSAISRTGGTIWELFQNVESILEDTHVEPGPIRVVQPEGRYSLAESGAYENDPGYIVSLPVGWGRWCYPSVLVLEDRVLISHTYSWYDEMGIRRNEGGSRLKVLPLPWFYGGREPYESRMLQNYQAARRAETPSP